MHLLLTDRLTCPRCGPTFGLILLAERMGGERRVRDGFLGCANCRDRFPVREGFGDLRAPPRGDPGPGRAGAPGAGDPEEASRLQALLGIAEGPGTVALLGVAARHAAGLARRVEGVEVVGVDADLARWPDRPRVSRMVAGPGIPFFSRTLRGVVADGGLGDPWLGDAARVVAPGSRVVVVEAGAGAAPALEGAGLSILAAELGTVVAARG